MEFRADLESNGKAATGIEVPAEWSRRSVWANPQPLRGHRYRTAIASVGGPGWTLESEDRW
jgi:hypothetical protein